MGALLSPTLPGQQSLSSAGPCPGLTIEFVLLATWPSYFQTVLFLQPLRVLGALCKVRHLGHSFNLVSFLRRCTSLSL